MNYKKQKIKIIYQNNKLKNFNKIYQKNKKKMIT